MPGFERKGQKCVFRGMSLNRPVDLLAEGKYAYAQDLRSYIDGRIESRPGLFKINSSAAGSRIQNVRRLNDSTPGAPAAWNRIIKMFDGQLKFGQTSFAATSPAVSNLSASPVTEVPYRPEGSPQSWLYIGDYNSSIVPVPGTARANKKVRTDGVAYDTGTQPPTVPATAADAGAGNLNGMYQYRYRWRSTTTGTRSQDSPAVAIDVTGTGIGANRNVTVTPQASLDPQIDVIDIFRYGGTLASWRLCGSSSNAAPAFTDTATDISLANAETLDFDHYAPWPSYLPRKSGTVSITSGSKQVLYVSGDQFHRYLDEDNFIIIDEHVYTIDYIADATTLWVKENGHATLGGAAYIIEEPLIKYQDIQCIFGPFGAGTQGAVIFGVGDPNEPGVLKWTKGNDADGASLTGSLELTGPSDVLQNGCLYDGRAFVFSTQKMFAIYPQLGGDQYVAQEVPGGRGLYARWAICIGDRIYFLGRDGIYASDGGACVSITDEDLYPLFPHDDQPGYQLTIASPLAGGSTITVNPPDYTKPQHMRLSYGDGYLYFDYVEANSSSGKTLVYDTRKQAWCFDRYGTFLGSNEAPVHYYEEGQTIANMIVSLGQTLYTLTGTVDDTQDIQMRFITGAFDGGDSRNKKLWGDVLVDANMNGEAGTVAIRGDNGTADIRAIASALSGSGRTQTVLDVNSGLGVLARNAQFHFECLANGATVELYEWMPSWVPRPIDSKLQATDWTEDGRRGAKLFRGIVIYADTSGTSRTIRVRKDGTTSNQQTLTVNHNGEIEAPFALTPFVAHTVRLVPDDANSWRLFGAQWIWDEYPELSTIQKDFDDLGLTGAKYVRGVVIEADTVNVATSVQVQTDTGTVQATLSCTHNGREEKAYAFATPFIAHELALVPQANWRYFKARWIFDEHPENAAIITPWSEAGVIGAKFFRGCILEADTANVATSVQVQIDGGTVQQTLTVQHNNQQEKSYDVTPFIAHLIRLVPLATWRFWRVRWIFDEYPELDNITTPWEDAGYQGAKFLQGMVLEADTGNAPINLDIQYDGGIIGATVTATHNGKVALPFSWNPFIAHNLRIVPAGNIRIFKIRWIWEPAPELAATWESQETTHDLQGWQHIRDGYIAHMSPADITLSISGDGNGTITKTIPASGGTYVKTYFVAPFNKFKSRRYRLTSASPFRLFAKDSEIRVRAWGSRDPYIKVTPFGDASREVGVRI